MRLGSPGYESPLWLLDGMDLEASRVDISFATSDQFGQRAMLLLLRRCNGSEYIELWSCRSGVETQLVDI